MIEWHNQERRDGYADGKGGRPASRSNQHYQRGWREGMKRRDFLLDVEALQAFSFYDTDPTRMTPPPIAIAYWPDLKPQEKNMPRTRTAAPRKLFVAVVFAERGQTDSLKGDGQWTCFIGTTQAEAVRKAMDARDRWDTSPIDRHRYVVLVGELTSKVKPRAAYDLVTLNA